MIKSKPFLSIIIPCYNEKENLQRGVLEEVYQFLLQEKFSWEVIISDDGSTDESRDLIKKVIGNEKNVFLLTNKHGGKPAAIWSGIQKSQGEYILFTDMDQSTPIDQITKFEPYFSSYDLVIGSRGGKRENFSWFRKLGSFIFRNIRKLILLRDINDTQCGFKSIKTQVAKKIFPQLEFFKNHREIKGWKVTSFDVELLFLAEKYGYRIKEIPVEWVDRDISKGKERSYLKESKEMFEQLFRVRINDINGKYN
jgi:dolichyl-phosphate beta-glucosyltransferase